MLVVYVAGPIRAATAQAMEENIQAAEKVALTLWRLGAAVICQHSFVRFSDGRLSHEVGIAGDVEIVKRCDAVVLLSGWSDSDGSRQEEACAMSCGIPAFEWNDPQQRQELIHMLASHRPYLCTYCGEHLRKEETTSHGFHPLNHRPIEVGGPGLCGPVVERERRTLRCS